MTTPEQIFIAENHEDRLDLFVCRQLAGISRSRIQNLIRDGSILLNEKACDPKTPVKAGDRLIVRIPEAKPMDLKAEKIPLSILFEDEHLVVVNKSAGMVVHPGAGHDLHTLVHALLHHCRGKLSGIGGVERPGIVHRLDKDTSGCLVVAKSDAAHQKLALDFQSRELVKIYLAVIMGKPRFRSGRVDEPIGRHPVDRKKMTPTNRGRPALTEWKVVKTATHCSLLECRIHTGRTHQIRVHLAAKGMHILGDAIYGGRAAKLAPRQLLHAWKLQFNHPITGEPLAFEAPMPEDMMKVLGMEGGK